MDDCDKPSSHDPLLVGHSEQCHLDDNACKSKLLYLRRLAPHFPNVRQLVHMIYVTGFVKIDPNHTGTEIHFIAEH